MNSRKEIAAVYAAGLIQGLALVAFPAASTILTNPQAYNFSSTAYGSLFIPQAILSIGASLLSMKLSKLYGSKPVFFAGMIANFLAMVLLAFSVVVMRDTSWAYGILLVATGCLGVGFGLTVPTLNTMAALIYPYQVDSTILILNALLGAGTALAPVFIALFTGLGFWWGLPVAVAILTILVLLYSWPLTLPGGKITSLGPTKQAMIPSRFWIFAAFALLYGIVETLNGNWVSLYMSQHEQATLAMQSLALAAFWGMVTIGRIFFALVEKKFPAMRAFQILPFITIIAFLLIASLPPHHEYWGIVLFGLAGFGCSALLPLTISFGSEQLKSIATSVAGGIIAFYLLGYGIAAFGAGPLQDMANLSLKEIYGIGAIIAIVLGLVASIIIKNQGETTEEEKI